MPIELNVCSRRYARVGPQAGAERAGPIYLWAAVACSSRCWL